MVSKVHQTALRHSSLQCVSWVPFTSLWMPLSEGRCRRVCCISWRCLQGISMLSRTPSVSPDRRFWDLSLRGRWEVAVNFWTVDRCSPCECKFSKSEDIPGLWPKSHFFYQWLWWFLIYVHTNASASKLLPTLLPGAQQIVRAWNPWRAATRKLQILQFSYIPLKDTCEVCPQSKNKWEETTGPYVSKFWDYQMVIRGCIHELLLGDESSACFWSAWLGSVYSIMMCRWIENKTQVITWKVQNTKQERGQIPELSSQLKKSVEESDAKTHWKEKKRLICKEYREIIFRTHSLNRE